MSLLGHLLGTETRADERDPKDKPQWWAGLLALPTASGERVSEKNALTFSAIWAAHNIIAGAVGMLPLNWHKRLDEGGKEKYTSDPVYTLLHDQANPVMSALTFKETIQGHVLSYGNGYAEIERDRAKRPIALWPLLPDKVAPEVYAGDKVRYRLGPNVAGSKRIPSEDILHIKGLGFDGIKGYGVIRYARESIGSALAAEKFGAKFFSNDARPGGVIEVEGELDGEGESNLIKSWNKEHQGVDNAYRVKVLEQGTKFTPIGIPPDAAQFIETRRFSVSDVARWYQIPLHMLSDLARATFSNIEHQGREFVILTLMRWLIRWEMECTYKLAGRGRRGKVLAKFNVNALLRGDTKTRFNAYHLALQDGWINRNEVRELEDLNPVDGLDEYLTALNMAPVGEEGNNNANNAGGNGETKSDDQASRFRALFQDTAQRIITKELNAITRALKKDGFREWAREFLPRHEKHVRTVLEPVIAAAGRPLEDASRIATAYVAARSADLARPLKEIDVLTLESWRADIPETLTLALAAGKWNGAHKEN